LLNILIDVGPDAIVNTVDDEHSNIDNFSAPGFRHLVEENELWWNVGDDGLTKAAYRGG
jgi:hypothetical protein